MAAHLSSRPGSPWLQGWSWLFSHGNHTLCPGVDNPALALSGPQRRAPQGRPRFIESHKDPNAAAAPHSRPALLNTHPYTQTHTKTHACTEMHTHRRTLISYSQLQQRDPESLKRAACAETQTHSHAVHTSKSEQWYILMLLQPFFIEKHKQDISEPANVNFTCATK